MDGANKEVSVKIDVFGYRFSGSFVENKGTDKEGHIKNGFLGQQARYMVLRQSDYYMKGKFIGRPKHIVWRDAHNNCCTSIDSDMISTFNAEAQKSRLPIYLLPSSRYYEPSWNDVALCKGNNLYMRRSAVAGWVQMCNFSNDEIFLDNKNFVCSAGLPFLINTKTQKPVLEQKRLGGNNEVVDGFAYGIDEYANTQFFNLPHFLENSIYVFHCYHSDLKSIDFFYDHDPVKYAYIMVTNFVLQQSTEKTMKRVDMIKLVEDLRNTNPETFDVELRSCLRLLLSLIPNKYQMLSTCFAVFDSSFYYENVNYDSVVSEQLKKYKYPALLQNITRENLEKLGLTCNLSIMMNSTDWCERPYFDQKTERSDCPPSLYLSGLYKDKLPETMVSQIRMPDDIATAIEKCRKNKKQLKLKMSDYKLDMKTKVPVELEKYTIDDGRMDDAVLKAILLEIDYESQQIIKKVSKALGKQGPKPQKRQILTKFIWRSLMMAGIDVPRKWFQIPAGFSYPPDKIFRPMVEKAKEYANNKSWVTSIMNILSKESALKL